MGECVFKIFNSGSFLSTNYSQKGQLWLSASEVNFESWGCPGVLGKVSGGLEAATFYQLIKYVSRF